MGHHYSVADTFCLQVKVPNARYVAVVLDGYLEMLDRMSGDIWVGHVSLDKPNLRKIALSANMMNDDENIYTSLLHFAIPTTNSLQHSAASNSSSER